MLVQPGCSELGKKKKKKRKRSNKKQKFNLRQHSVLDWSPTSILSGPCDACLRGSDETRKVHRGMAADKVPCLAWQYIPLSSTTCHYIKTSLMTPQMYCNCQLPFSSCWPVPSLRLVALQGSRLFPDRDSSLPGGRLFSVRNLFCCDSF
jgi:hypothetical protein